MTTTTRTLTGIEALGYALLHELPTVLVAGVETPIGQARVVSYDAPESVTIAATIEARGWNPGHIQRLSEGGMSLPRARRTTADTQSLAAHEEYVAAGKIATEERALYDAVEAQIRKAGWRASQYETGRYYKVGGDGKPTKKGGRTWLLSRPEVLAECGLT